MPSAVILVLLALAVAHGTWLVVDAGITLPLRQWVVNRFGAESKPAYLVHCPGCTATWISIILTPITFLLAQNLIWACFLALLAAARVAPIVMAMTDRLEVGGD